MQNLARKGDKIEKIFNFYDLQFFKKDNEIEYPINLRDNYFNTYQLVIL